ncbi:MAG: aldehyde dehydrogenase family protein [Planctomycetota bacterium]|nr:MAG: aldehyde dehydrogenase family protein [Planctomycetota bacterium]
MDNASPLLSHSPWDGRCIWQGRRSSSAEAWAALDGLQRAFPAWAGQAPAQRDAALRELGCVLEGQQEELCELLITEAGKHPRDAQSEVALLGKKISITLEQGRALFPQLPPRPESDPPHTIYRPRGPALIVGPFNFPLHLVHGLVVPALAMGSPVLIKPSERCPAVAAAYYRACIAAGLGEVVALAQGGPEVVAPLLRHPALTTVAAVASRRTGAALSQALAGRPEVLLALELGGVNHALVCADADLQACARDLAMGAWSMSGQRCTATRIAQVPRALCPQLIALLQQAAADWQPQQACGPLIDGESASAFRRAWQQRPAALQLLHGEIHEGEGSNAFQAPLLALVNDGAARQHSLYQEEHFGPALIIDPYEDENEALARMAANPARLAASVFCAERSHFLRLAQALDYGQVNHNRPTAGARSDQPFGGRAASGNGRPAALHAANIFADACVIW